VTASRPSPAARAWAGNACKLAFLDAAYPKIINKAATSTRTTKQTNQMTKNRLPRFM
jgi:hypothetical protein